MTNSPNWWTAPFALIENGGTSVQFVVIGAVIDVAYRCGRDPAHNSIPVR